MQEYLAVLKKKYVAFNGRAGRREYWMFTLVSIIVTVILIVVDSILGTESGGYGLFSSLYGLAVFLPSLGVTFRRLHDINSSGWWILVSLIPVVGWIWFIVLLASKGTEGDNNYGPVPPPVTAAA